MAARPEEFSYRLAYRDIDLSLLPPTARTPGTDAFREAINRYITGQYRHFGGRVQILIDDTRQVVDVRWSPDPLKPDPLDVVLDKLQRCDYQSAIPMLETLRQLQPQVAQHAHNLGMALSDTGKLSEAQVVLREAIQLDPADINIRVALGVAQFRAGSTSDAIGTLTEAVRMDASNPWAQRNLGACLLRAGQTEDAETHLRRAAELAPNDQQAVCGLAQALEAEQKLSEADELYIRAIGLNPSSPVADVAKEARSRLAQDQFRKTAGGVERMDAVMYLLGAIRRFDQMAPAEVQRVGMEIAVLGMKGLDPNDPAQKYRLQTLPGSFSGLHLVCLMFVAFRRIAPERSVGFDLSREFAIAEQMHRTKRSGD